MLFSFGGNAYALTAADYTVTVTPADTTVKEYSASVTCEAAKLTKLVFSDELILASASDFYTHAQSLCGQAVWSETAPSPCRGSDSLVY